MNKITVCFTHDDALDLFRGSNGVRFGGAETQVYLLARMLAGDPMFDVRFVSERDVSNLQHEGIRFLAPRPPVRRGLPYVSRLVNARRAAAPYEGADVLIQTIAGPNTIRAWKTARRHGLKFVPRMSCDADIDATFMDPEMAGRYFEALKDADGIIAQTNQQKQRLLSELSVDSTVVPSIVELPGGGPNPGGAYVLWVGRGAPIKRPWIAVQVARSLPEYRFVMVMPKEEPLFWRYVVQEAARLPNLTIIPGLPYFEMGRQFREAAILLNTSGVEGFPNVFLQAAAQGTPIVSLDVDPDGMLETQGCGFYAEGDIERMCAVIAELMSDSEMLRNRGMSAFAYVERHHNPGAVSPILTEFLRSVTSS